MRQSNASPLMKKSTKVTKARIERIRHDGSYTALASLQWLMSVRLFSVNLWNLKNVQLRNFKYQLFANPENSEKVAPF